MSATKWTWPRRNGLSIKNRSRRLARLKLAAIAGLTALFASIAGEVIAQDWSAAFDVSGETASIVDTIARIDTTKRNAVTEFVSDTLDPGAYLAILSGTARIAESEALRARARLFAIETIGMSDLPRARTERSISAIALTGEFESLSTYYCAVAVTSALKSVSASLDDERQLLEQLNSIDKALLRELEEDIRLAELGLNPAELRLLAALFGNRPDLLVSRQQLSAEGQRLEARLAETKQVMEQRRGRADGFKQSCRATQFRVLAGAQREAHLALVVVERPGEALMVSVLPADTDRRQLRMTEAHGDDAEAWGAAVLDASLYRKAR